MPDLTHAFFEAASSFTYARLRVSDYDLTPELLAPELVSAASGFYGVYSGLLAYADMTDGEKAAFAEAVGKETACRLFAGQTTGPNGVLQEQTQSTITKYAPRSPEEMKHLADEVRAAMLRIVVVRNQESAAAQSYSPFGIATRTQADCRYRR